MPSKFDDMLSDGHRRRRVSRAGGDRMTAQEREDRRYRVTTGILSVLLAVSMFFLMAWLFR